ncbi:Hypothetical protein R9X50_00728700 [Acrodontium crateriforme]|uniref:Peptidase A1 domain-containing protein n=1 Tax=Acrodontium crateriforme TaxID=150365 RepID=A0AAQ3RC41_9PEZI|nr:Hypothetical protein R9X50_00728700 [Acrodontium crateriforme]
MQRTFFFVLVALVATALAAPLQPLVKRSRFSIPVNGRHGRHGQPLHPRKEMERIFAKYNWDLSLGMPTTGLGLDSGSGSSLTSGLDNLGDLGLGGLESSIMSIVNPLFTTVPTVASQASSAVATSITSAAVVSQTAPSQPDDPPFSQANATSAVPTASSTTPATNASGGETAEVTASPEANDAEYLSPVSIGGQTLNLDFDTGSADLWVFSTELPTSETSGHTTFDPSKSSTFKKYDGATWKISYGDGSGASGDVGFDNVAIGGATATSQAVELATSVSSQFVSDQANDGLLGLAFSNINTVSPTKQKTWFETIKSQLENPLFTADLEKDASGTYDFGNIDSSKYTGDIHYAPVDKSGGFWEFNSKSYSIGGTKSSCTTCSPAIADTGTSLLLVDDDVAKAYYAQVDGSKNDSTQGGYVYPCSSNLPDFGIAIGDYIAVLKGSDLTYANVDSSTCFGGIQSNANSGMQIFGDVMFKQYFAVFDAGNTQFGVASKA